MASPTGRVDTYAPGGGETYELSLYGTVRKAASTLGAEVPAGRSNRGASRTRRVMVHLPVSMNTGKPTTAAANKCSRTMKRER